MQNDMIRNTDFRGLAQIIFIYDLTIYYLLFEH